MNAGSRGVGTVACCLAISRESLRCENRPTGLGSVSDSAGTGTQYAVVQRIHATSGGGHSLQLRSPKGLFQRFKLEGITDLKGVFGVE